MLRTSNGRHRLASRNAEEIDRDDLFEHVGLVLVATTRQVLARVVHEHIERGERARQAGDLRGGRHVALVVGERREIDVVRVGAVPGPGDRHFRTRVMERVRDRVTDPRRSPGDEHTAAGEVERHSHTGSQRRVSADRYIASAHRSSPSAYSGGTAGAVPSSTADAKSAHSPS